MPTEPLVLDSVTHLKPEYAGRASICASHGGIYAAYYAAKLGTAGVILSNAGVGRERAGLAGLYLLERMDVPAATVAHTSAQIGNGADCHARGVISHVNAPAGRVGLEAGMAARDALALLAAHGGPASAKPDPIAESREMVSLDAYPSVRIAVVDSISLVSDEDIGQIVVSASHGGILGGDPATATKVRAFAVVCNDAGFGIDAAGISRLPALDAAGLAAGCVSAFSARIGDGRSTWNDGYISAVNATAAAHGGEIGQSCRQFVEAMARVRSRS